MEINNEELKMLFNTLKSNYGAIKRAAEKAGCTTVWLRRVLRDCEYYSEKVVDAALEVVEEIEKEKVAKRKLRQDRMAQIREKLATQVA